MESRHCGQDKRIFFCPVHNASTPCSLQAFGKKVYNLVHLVKQIYMTNYYFGYYILLLLFLF